MSERIFEGFIDHIEDGVIYAAGECKGELVLTDLPESKWPLGHPKTPGTVFFIEINGAFTDIRFPTDEELPLLSPWQRFNLWIQSVLKRIAKDA